MADSAAQQIRKVTPRVKYILEHYPQARESDKYLYLVYLRTYTSAALMLCDWAQFESYVMSKDVPALESISRARRKIQEGPNGVFKSTRQLQKIANEASVRSWAKNG